MRIPPSSTTTSPFSSSNALFRDVAAARCRRGAAEETSTAFPEISLPLPVEVDRRFGSTAFPPAPEMLLLLLLLLSIDRSGAEIDSRTAFPAAPEMLLLAIDGERKFALLSFLAPWSRSLPVEVDRRFVLLFLLQHLRCWLLAVAVERKISYFFLFLHLRCCCCSLSKWSVNCYVFLFLHLR